MSPITDIAPKTSTVSALRSRADALRETARTLPDPVARAYARRAAELELQAWATEIRANPHVAMPLAA